ncbi:hypothetical protein PspLS_03168 [Pyricularia sp. CBS 133598]|nr:hypothetical protein PspLS_03168 [Pyricularia sp. CBS 133598]
MSDPDKKEDAPVPAWQQQQQSSDGSTLDHARLFLQDEEVRQASREKKISFLRSKGVSEADIETLLGDDESNSSTSDSSQTALAAPQPAQEEPTTPQPQPQPQTQSQAQVQQQPPQQQSQPAQKSDQPPIVTYPEFLTKPPRPPPLITATTFLNTASAFAGLATLIIGTSKYVLSPMVESLTDARIDLHRSASDGLSRTIEKLEGIVSEIPPLPVAGTQDKAVRAAKKPDDNDTASSDGGDPTELFHRDVGVQTSPPQTPSTTTASTQKPSAIESQATRLAKLTASVREMSASYATTAETHESTSVVLGHLSADVDKLRTPVATRPAGTVYYRAFAEPDDQVKAVKQSIRSVKGVLLSARSFPPPQGSTVR